MIPVAVIHVNADGSLGTEAHRAPVSGAPTPEKTGTGIYSVGLPGAPFFFSDDAAVCTSIGTTAGWASVTSVGGNTLRVITHDAAGAPDDNQFYCAVYDLN